MIEMMGSGLPAATTQMAAGGASDAPAVAKTSPNQEDLTKFLELLNTTDGVSGESSVIAVSEGAAIPGTELDGIGDAILRGFQSLNEAHSHHVESVNGMLESSGGNMLTYQDTLKLQFEIAQMNLQQDMTAKIADKSSNGIQTLFRNQ